MPFPRRAFKAMESEREERRRPQRQSAVDSRSGDRDGCSRPARVVPISRRLQAVHRSNMEENLRIRIQAKHQ